MRLLSQMSSKDKLAFRKSLHIDKGFSKTISLDIPSTDIPSQALEQGLRTHVIGKLKIPVTRVQISMFQEPKGTFRISPTSHPCWKAAWFSGASKVYSKYFVFIPVFHNAVQPWTFFLTTWCYYCIDWKIRIKIVPMYSVKLLSTLNEMMCILHLGQRGPSKIKFCTNTHCYNCSHNVQGRQYFSMLHLRNLKLREVTHLKSLLPLPVCQTKCCPTSWHNMNALFSVKLFLVHVHLQMGKYTHTYTYTASRVGKMFPFTICFP